MFRKASYGPTHRLALFIMLLTIPVLLLKLTLTQAAATQQAPLWDLEYHYEVGTPITIESIDDNLSGLAYHPESDHLYAVLNNPEKIIEMTKQGKVVRTIDLQGFVDTESIDYLGNNLFVVSEERRRRLVFFYLNADISVVHYQNAQVLPLDRASNENTGFEGVAWSPAYGFFVLQEYPPRLIHHMMHDAEPAKDLQPLVRSKSLDVSDYAGISMLHGDQDMLLVLSEASHSLHALDLNGNPLSRLSLRTGLLKLWPLMEQPEGVTVDKDGNIFIVGEPNQLVMLSRKTRLAQSAATPQS
ncbi:SdiA-regulated domain-containing protein [Methylophaga sp. OBS4]|uniref:SdiA-regulated domain-containing protein n=1 Tax=Methylophaga sp. OBS4 TaxID=2991935 RepID=UPI00225ACED3|nr:SdiA-regulated domain-containing protein [Methylophaga sp. OBS4]MCX4187427.1 SdiA-regulated domain-containing protein [Methylophaga sp. OBS4]